MKVVAFKLLGLVFSIPLLTVSHFTVCVVFLILTIVIEVKSEFRKNVFVISNFFVL
jgi:hypothetical protein